MPVKFRVFASGRLAEQNQVNTFYPLFTVPTGKSYVVNAMRFVNTQSTPVPFNIALHRGVSTITLFPDTKDWPLGSGQCAIEDRELTLGPGEVLCARAGIANMIDFVISGVERDS